MSAAQGSISIDLVERSACLNNLKSAAKAAVRDQHPGSLKFDFYDWIVNYCIDPVGDQFMVKAPDFSLPLVSLMALHTRHVMSMRKTKFKISQWRLILEDVLGYAPKKQLRTLAGTLSELCDAITELLVGQAGSRKALTETAVYHPEPAVPRTRTIDKLVGVKPRVGGSRVERSAAAAPEEPGGQWQPHPSPLPSTTAVKRVIKAAPPRQRRGQGAALGRFDGYGASLREALQKQGRRVSPARRPIEPKYPVPQSPPPRSELMSTEAPSSACGGLLSGLTGDQVLSAISALPGPRELPKPPENWQISGDDDALVLYQEVCMPSVSMGVPAVGTATPPTAPPCPMAVPWEQSSFLE